MRDTRADVSPPQLAKLTDLAATAPSADRIRGTADVRAVLALWPGNDAITALLDLG